MQNFNDIKELIKYLNDYRLANKNTWFNNTVIYKGEPFGIKFYNTWSQVMYYKGRRASGLHDLSVAAWKNEIIEFLNN